MRSTLQSLILLSFAIAGALHSRPVDLSIPPGGHGPIDSRGYAQHWVELAEVNFGSGLALPLRLSFLSSRSGPHGFGDGLWQAPLLASQFISRSPTQWSVLLPCGKVLSLQADAAQPGRFATPDGEWLGIVKGSRTLISREDGWEMEFNPRGHLIRLRTDTGRTLLWNRMADGSLRTLTEVAQNSLIATGLTVNKDATTGQITSLEVRTSTGVKTWKLAYMQSGQRLTEITFPDRSAEHIRYTFDASANPGMTIQSRSLTENTLIWRKTAHTLISDGLWTYNFKQQKGDMYPITTRIGPGGEKEIFHDDFKNGRTLFTSADGTTTIRQNVVAPGPAKGRLQSITRQQAGAQQAITLYLATYDPQTGMIAEDVGALGHKTLHQHELYGTTPHSGIKRHTVTDSLGNKTITEFDIHGNLLATTNALGHTTRHEYDAQNRRIRTIGPDGIVVEALTYNALGKIETRTDALGAVTTHGYNERGNRISITDALGYVTRHEYDDRGNRTATIDAHGHTTRYEYDAGNHLVATTLPEVGEKQPQAEKGAKKPSATRYTYDSKGRLVRTTAPDGTVTSLITYDAFGSITSDTNALGHVIKFEYDLKKGAFGCKACSSSSAQPTRIISPSGRITERTYNVDQCLLTETIAVGTPEAATTTNTYDLVGQVLSTTDPLGRTTAFEYDASGNRANVIYPDKTKRGYAFDAVGQIVAETNELGHTIKRDYDSYGNMVALTDAEGHVSRVIYGGSETNTAGAKKDTHLPASIGPAGLAVLHRPAMFVSGAGIRTQIDYDALGRRIAITKAPGTPDSSSTRHEYDAVGNEIVTITSIGASGDEPKAENEEQKTVHTYDSRKRLLTTTDSLNRTWTFMYSDRSDSSDAAPCCGADPTSASRATTIINPDGTREEKIYDPTGQLVETRDANVTARLAKVGGAAPQPYVAGVRYEHDRDGHLTQLTDANGHTTKWRYNVRGKLISKTYPDNNTELYEHDSGGQLIVRVRPDGTRASHTYDMRGRLIGVAWNDGKTENSSFAYDAAGHLVLAENKSAKIQRSYTPSGRMDRETQQITSLVKNAPAAPQSGDPLIAEVGYQYDADGRLTQLTYPDQSSVRYRYGARGELAEVQDSGNPQDEKSAQLQYHYTRRLDGRVTQITLPNGMVTNKDYDKVGHLSKIEHLDSEGHVLFSEESRYDQLSHRIARVQADGSTDLFGYDPAGQVTAAAYGQAGDVVSAESGKRPTENSTLSFKPSQTFSYDPAGNRQETTDNGMITKYQANAANQYTQIESLVGNQSLIQEPLFDKLGNLLHDDEGTYEWDADIHLLSVTTKPSTSAAGKSQPASTTSFQYDPLNRRVARHESTTNTTTLFIHDGWNVVSEYETTQAGSDPRMATRRVWGQDISETFKRAGGIGGLLASQKTDRRTGGDANCFHYDSNGNVVLLTNNKGRETGRYRYDAFGKTLAATGEAAQNNEYRFATKPAEKSSGLIYYGYRYYSPARGGWPNRDPSGERGGINLFLFVNNNAISYSDRLGLELMDALILEQSYGTYAQYTQAGGNPAKNIGFTNGTKWPEIIAIATVNEDTPEGKWTVAVHGSYYIEVALGPDAGPHPVDGLGTNNTRDHEYVHANMYASFWSNLKAFSTQYDNRHYCSQQCAELMADYINAESSAAKYAAQAEGLKQDNQAYNAGNDFSAEQALSKFHDRRKQDLAKAYTDAGCDNQF